MIYIQPNKQALRIIFRLSLFFFIARHGQEFVSVHAFISAGLSMGQKMQEHRYHWLFSLLLADSYEYHEMTIKK
jgi:hypothetical protein